LQSGGSAVEDIDAARRGKGKNRSIGKITYHFLQLDGWIITVNYIKPRIKNSGWLMAALQQADNQKKCSI
jgi:hypothetical protein